METRTESPADWASDRRMAFWLWRLPAALLVLSAFVPLSAPLRGVWWGVGFGAMSVACAANAWRCRRLHCFFTAPFFLAIGVLALLHGAALLPLGEHGFRWLGAVALVGGVALIVVPERLFGTYAGAS